MALYNPPPIGTPTPSPALNPLAAALMQGGVPGSPSPGGANPYGPPPGQGGLPQPLTGGAAPGSIPLGAPTNQFGNAPIAPVARPAQALGAPVGAGIPQGGAPLARPAMPVGAPGLGTRPFGFGGMQPAVRPQGY